jgi:HAD superfamily hydrolase (TIGR01509 family)
MATAAVIFDMDGLLVDTERLQFGASDLVLRDLRGVTLPREVMVSLVGLRSDQCWMRMKELYDLDESVEELEAAQSRYYAPMLREQSEAMPGARELIAALHAEGYPLAIASSSPLWQIDAVVERLGIRDVLRAVASGEEVAHGKPAPDVYLLAAERLGVAPERCVALEDSGPGTMAAKAAGMRVIAVPTAETASHSFAPADLVLSSLVGAAPQVTSLLNGHVPFPNAPLDGGG